NLSINAELAILSACETGYGYLERGEGLISLGRAFKLAGCPTTTMSIWKAQDFSTSKIMVKYAEYLSKGVSKDRALQRAKIDYLDMADINTSHPYFWAPFILHGNKEPLSFVSHGGLSSVWLILGLSLVGLVAITFFVRYKFKK
ncbi:MAG: CHAT domain-containing protein, partial [Bacteroidota bacterium]